MKKRYQFRVDTWKTKTKRLILFFAIGIISPQVNATDTQDAKKPEPNGGIHKQQKLPKQSLAFEENKGQITGADAHNARFMLQDGNTKVFLLNDRIAYQFEKIHPVDKKDAHRSRKAKEILEQRRDRVNNAQEASLETYRMDAVLVNANLHSVTIADEQQSDITHYYNHNVTNVRRYTKVTYKNVYPNIDWIVFVKDGGIEYDFAVHPGGNPALIKIRYEETENLGLLKNGSLKVVNRLGSLTEAAPISFQGNSTVPTRYKLEGNTLSFDVAAYDQNRTLVIDPEVGWATYYGYDGWGGMAMKAETDREGNIYFVGGSYTTTNLASPGAHQTVYGGAFSDGFIIKFDSAGNRVWASYYGGSAGEEVWDCAADQHGNVYFIGYTSSINNISTAGSHQPIFGGGSDGFLVKFNADGVRQWATYYGGADYDDPYSCTVDTLGNVYMAGSSASFTGIATTGTHRAITDGSNDGYLVKFDSNGVRQWGTYFGGDGWDMAQHCHAANDGSVYVSGIAESENDVATAGAYQAIQGGSSDGFVAKFSNTGTLIWATYYGGDGYDDASSVSTDVAGNVYLFGNTESTTGIASAGSHQDTYGGGWFNIFAAKFDSAGAYQWGTYYGGEGGEYCFMGDVDAAGNVYVYGESYSLTGISTPGAIKEIGDADEGDVFVAKLNTNGVRQWGTYYGGDEMEEGYFCKTDRYGNFYFGGRTRSTTGIATPAAYQDTYAPGSSNFFLVKLNTCTDYAIVTDTLVDSVAVGSTYTLDYNGLTYAPGIHIYDTLTNLVGCDSAVLVLNLSTYQTSSILEWKQIAGKLYPNPTSQLLYFEFNSAVAGLAHYQITDVTGRVLLAKENVLIKNAGNNIAVDVEKVLPGIYYFQFSLPTSGARYVSKFVIAK